MIDEFKQLIENACSIEMQLTNSVQQGISIDSIEIFQQTWPSTALGFPGCGGDAMTTAFTTVIHMHNDKGVKCKKDNGEEISITEYYLVFFGSRCAYSVYSPTECFYSDLIKHQMADCEKAKTLY